ncbi:uncharacterized protein Z520_06396 [Fonsecaea multimorphosa CBS 102226]|uniref:SEC7 domain-containing protein n=1 Tax=Fonsecaea multimorphosa CBS 102226 TaxID=1442371 RepID=A0A0D2KLP9_9EURO|nr:uncharacterized protein Z520_06396 [Fonsecaea multimorphosa CBS 102226]KIX97618.1 hypothetical protein Z520_06396 [Fonsecaea multimorphosa CBS 102226]OAL24081.1 hypothetical protein AYO22_05962 [Fonsecaea multimorphosa]
MPLRTLLPSKPASGPLHRRHSSIVEDPPSTSASSNGPPTRTRSRGSSLKRLSLSLSRTNEEPFPPFLTQDLEGLPSHQPSVQPDGPSHQPDLPKSASTPITRSSTRIDGEARNGLQNDLDSGPLPMPQRLSLLGLRHASDPQLSTRFKNEEISPSNDVPPPTIITTAPTTNEFDEPIQKPSKRRLFARAPSPFRKSHSFRRTILDPLKSTATEDGQDEKGSLAKPGILKESTSFERLPRPKTGHSGGEPPAYGDESSSSLAIPITRLSESSRSDDSSGDHHVYAKTTTTHTISTTTTFFKLKRRKKNKGPLFPLPEKFATPASGRTTTSHTPQESLFGRKSMSPSRRSNTAVRFDTEPSRHGSAVPSPTHSAVALTNAPFGSPGATIVRQDSNWSTHSGQSTPSVTLIPPRVSGRGRSSTLSSLGKSTERLSDAGPQPASTRTSTSTSGRRSFGDLLSLPHRLRQNSAPPTRPGAGSAPGTPGSKSNSLHIPREPEPERVYPKREDGDTPASYLEKLEAAVPRGAMASILCKSGDDFSKTCLRKYMRGFSYFGDSIDMAIRKMLMEVELPKETQQIDRLLAGFADRYYECNPGIFSSTDEAAFVAFSILLLHSDTHNKNNKRKMQKQDYVKNTQQGPVQISSDILDCFYDNVCYTPFIHFEDEVAVNSHRLSAPKPKRSLIKTRSLESLRGPVDPYTLILDNKLDVLRPSLKDVMDTEDCYCSTGTSGVLETDHHHRAFVNSAVLQIVSARSRPDAFLSQVGISNPGEAQAGLVSIKVAKVGLLWRKDPKKKKAKRPWQEWGAILTDSKLYFFKDVGWVKKLMAQYDAHSKSSNRSASLVFKPPLTSFDPDALMSMDDAVALLDSSYKKHKNAFVFIKHGGFEEIFLANSEVEMNDWIGKLNYAATFRTAGVRMRGLLGSNYEARHLVRKDSDFSTKSGDTPQKDKRGDSQMAWEIMFYRRQLINEKISDFDERIAVAQKELDHLLRNARHLLILLPIQQKTREFLVLAAGRMSAKLKWTRVELWRTRTHRDILFKDLEEEGATAFPAPKGSLTTTPQKTTPLKTGQADLGRTITDTSHVTLSPISATSSRPSNIIEKLKTSENVSMRTDHSTVDLPSTTSPSLSAEPSLSRHESIQDSHSLSHQVSSTSSRHSRDKDRLARGADDSEERVLREAGLMHVDGNVARDRRPDTSESERDRVGAMAGAAEPSSKTGSVRRSLQRSLREPHHPHHPHHHHQSPSVHRHKKAKESGSSLATTEDGGKSVHGEAEELRRGAGSFILHGKKASVITMSPEWQHMSNEERLKLRKAERENEEAVDGKAPVSTTLYNRDATLGTANNASSTHEEEWDDRFRSPNSSRKQSFATTSGEQFVDAETGEGDGAAEAASGEEAERK